MADSKTLTFGQKAVGLSFNPSGNEAVDKIKTAYADIIDTLNDARTNAGGQHAEDNGGDGEVSRLYSIAITKAQDAQMWAVKAATWVSSTSEQQSSQSGAQTAGSASGGQAGSGSSGSASGATSQT